MIQLRLTSKAHPFRIQGGPPKPAFILSSARFDPPRQLTRSLKAIQTPVSHIPEFLTIDLAALAGVGGFESDGTWRPFLMTTPPSQKATFDALWNLADPYVRDAGLELVELEFGREPEGFVLRVYIDFPWSPWPSLPGAVAGESGAGSTGAAEGASASPSIDDLVEPRYVGLAECERVSRDLSAALDVSQLISHAYRLEVSSPGIERPLRRESDFQRFVGRRVKARTHQPVDGRRNFSGTLQGVDEGTVLMDCDGVACRVPLEQLAKAHLVPDWAEEFRKSEARSQARTKERSAS